MEMPCGVVEQKAFGNFQPRASTGSYWVGSDNYFLFLILQGFLPV